ncbi:MAG: hypothetical protein K0U10_06590 [Gammaproteobacteria bacterium]|nr:hypothetical protein [Gammaproteobacteria bacterium]
MPNATSGTGLAAVAIGAMAMVEPTSAALASAAVSVRRMVEAFPHVPIRPIRIAHAG